MTHAMHADQATVLVVDDEPGIVDVLTYALAEAGYRTLVANDGVAALRIALTESPDLVLLDIMLPGLDGLTVCRELRAANRGVGIILLTAKATEADRVSGLELDADDYIVKPFSVREVIARVRTVLRRTASGTGSPGDEITEKGAPIDNASAAVIELGALALDRGTFEARWDGHTIELTRLQFDLLWLLASRPRMIFTRAQLLETVWGQSFTEDLRTVDSMVKRVRARLKEAGAPPELVSSRRDVGYCLDPAVAAPPN